MPALAGSMWSGALLLALAAVQAADEPDRRIQITIYGEERCPEAAPDEIVVCARVPEEERYRIPKPLCQRSEEPVAGGVAWGAQVEAMEGAMRYTRPNGCSVAGSNGQTGCTSEMIRHWYAERRSGR